MGCVGLTNDCITSLYVYESYVDTTMYVDMHYGVNNQVIMGTSLVGLNKINSFTRVQ
jgi:hypothetical protein